MHLNAAIDNLAQLFLVDEEIHLEQEAVFGNGAIHIAQILRDGLVEQDAAHRGIDDAACRDAVCFDGAAHSDLCLQRYRALLISHNGLVLVAEHLALAFVPVVHHRQVVAAQNHVLRRHGNRLAVGRLEQIAGGKHQLARLALRLFRERHVHGHLVAVEIRVERGAHQRVQLDGTALHEHRLERLNAQTMQRRRAVQHYGVPFDHGLQRIPHLGAGALHHFAGRFDVVGDALFHQILHDKRLEQLERHLFGQAALVHFQLRAHHDNRAAGIIHAFAQQVLAETALLALEHIRKAFERAVVRPRYRAAAPAVVDESVHRLLQHAFFVAHNNIRRAQLQQPL